MTENSMKNIGAEKQPGNKLACEIVFDRTLNFAMYNNDVPFIKSICLTNTTDEKLSGIDLKLSFWPDFADEYHYHVEELPAGTSVAIQSIDIKVHPEYLYSLSERIKGQTTCTVISNDELLYDNKSEISLLAFDEWNGGLSIPEIIAAFIIPNSDSINTIIRQAADYMHSWTGSSAIDGYQSGDPNRVKQLMAAIFRAIQDLEIDYINPPASFEKAGQRIRLPDSIMQTKTGTCLDLSLLYAAALEVAGLNALVIFMKGHAFTGGWLVKETFPEGAFADYSMLVKRTAEGINDICLVESTIMTRGRAFSFDDASAAAMSHFDDPERFRYFIDVKRARISQIRPLPVRSAYKSYSAYKENPELHTVTDISAPSFVNKIEFVESKNEAVFSRTENWQKQLLDLSLRNNLINLRYSASAISILCPDICVLEDSLSGGKEFSLLPVPAEIADSVRDFETYKRRTGNNMIDEVIANEYRQGRLRTMQSESTLNKSIVDIYRKAKRSMEENGANILYLAIGTLRWYENVSSETPRYAPLILMPLEIVRKSAAFGYIIRKRDEDAIFNYTLVEFLKNTYGIDLSSIEQMPVDDSGIDVRKIFAIVNHQVMTKSRWGVEETALISSFSFNKFVMWNDLKNHMVNLQQNKVVNALMRGYSESEFENAAQHLHINDKFDTAFGSYSSLLTPISADSSQMQAIYAANQGVSFILHGPPGTGKSQTITNMIANLIGNGKTVLFVAEKMAALSVVEKRLSLIGLAPFCLELHSNKSNKKDILKKLEDTMNMGTYQNSPQWEETLASLETVKTALNDYVDALHKRHEIGFSVYDAIQKIDEFRDINSPMLFSAEEAYAYSDTQFASAREYIRKLAVVGKSCGHPYNNPLSPIKLKSYSLTLSQNLPYMIHSSRDAFTALLRAGDTFQEYLGPEIDVSAVSFNDLSDILKICNLSMADYNFTAELWNEVDYSYVRAQIDLACKYVAARLEILKNYDVRIDQIQIDRIISEYNISQSKNFFTRLSGKNKAHKAIIAFRKPGIKLDKRDLTNELSIISEFVSLHEQFKSNIPLFQRLYSKNVTITDNFTVYTEIINIAENIHTIWKNIKNPDTSSKMKSRLAHLAGRCKAESQACIDLLTSYVKSTDEVLSALESGAVKIKSITAIDEILHTFSENLSGIQNICAYNMTADEAYGMNLSQIITAYENGSIKDHVMAAFEKSFYTAWFDKVLYDSPSLNRFTKEIHEDTISRFLDLDNKYTMLVRQEIFKRLVSRLPAYSENVNGTSEVGILTRAIHSGGRGVALRKLFSAIPNLLSKLAPCMLMSPISVAQYLEAGYPAFDVVIFDEASQMPTHEAVGAIARGKNLIVVGDPKQLPPTTFFSARQIEQDDDLMLSDLESILDDCMAINMSSISLSWHYRSRHESLIAFSNYNFYDGKLLTFPSYDDERTQIDFINTHGAYSRGGTRQNKTEAIAVADAIEKLAAENPLQSIGVVALSQAQQTLIEDMLDERYKTNTSLEKYNQESHEPIFIKNLENVQGDERDIIIFSIGYGKDEKGYMSMNFGPINKNGGWRRLNVAISRARQRLIVFSSIGAEDIDLSRTSMTGVMYLRSFLQYAESKAKYIPATNVSGLYEESISTIEADIYHRLTEKGYKVQKNVGKSRYKIPLAVLGEDGHYILGIQFDGPYYKDAKTARDREILIDSVLKNLNWNIYHVWSQKWLSSPEDEFSNILSTLEKVKKEPDIQQPAIQYKADFATSTPANTKTPTVYYNTAALNPVGMSTESFYTVQSNQLILSQISEIIEKEAPVSFLYICRKIAAAWGMKRVGNKIANRIQTLLKGFTSTTFNNGVFYWGKLNPDSYDIYRVPKNDQERRQPEDIAPTEICNAAKSILLEQIALTEAALAKETANIFGYARVMETTAEKFAEILRYGKNEGMLNMDSNGKFIL